MILLDSVDIVQIELPHSGTFLCLCGGNSERFQDINLSVAWSY